MFLEDSAGTTEVFNFDITPDNPYFDENGKEIVKIFQNDTDRNAWFDHEQRRALHTAVAKIVAKQVVKETGINAGQTDRRAKLFKILSIIVSECYRILMRAYKDKQYEEWLNVQTPQGRLDLFWIDWMCNAFMPWFLRLQYDSTVVDYITTERGRNQPSYVWLTERREQLGASTLIIEPTLISTLRGINRENKKVYGPYVEKYVSWDIKDAYQQNHKRWLNEKQRDTIVPTVGRPNDPWKYPVVGDSTHKSTEIQLDDFLKGSLMNLSYGNKLTFKALDDDTEAPTVQPTVHSVKHKFLFHNKGNSSKSKSFKIDSDKVYTFKVSRTGTPTLFE